MELKKELENLIGKEKLEQILAVLNSLNSNTKDYITVNYFHKKYRVILRIPGKGKGKSYHVYSSTDKKNALKVKLLLRLLKLYT